MKSTHGKSRYEGGEERKEEQIKTKKTGEAAAVYEDRRSIECVWVCVCIMIIIFISTKNYDII